MTDMYTRPIQGDRLDMAPSGGSSREIICSSPAEFRIRIGFVGSGICSSSHRGGRRRLMIIDEQQLLYRGISQSSS